MLDGFEFFHALLVGDAGFLQFHDFFALQFIDLAPENLVRVFDDGLAEREHVERVIGIRGTGLLTGFLSRGRGIMERLGGSIGDTGRETDATG